MTHWDRRELNKLVAENPDEYKKRFPEPFSAMIPEDASSSNKLATEAYVDEHGGNGSDPEAVKYTEQALTAEQKAQALANIGAASEGDVAALADQKYEGPYATDGDLPAASASTMGAIYLVGPDANDEYERKVTKLSGSTYSWVSLGTTAITLANYATKEEVTELEHEVDEIADTSTIDVTGTGTFQVGRLLYSSVNPQSIYPNYTAYRYQLFNAKKGDVIAYKSMADTGTAILGVQNANDSTKYNSLVAGIGTSNYVEGTYTVPSDNVYCICGYNNKETVASITRIGRIPALEGKVQEMDTDFSQSIQSLEENVNTIKREIGIYPLGENLIGLCSVEDGKYIGYNGGVMSLAGYSIYSLPVENATQIKNKGAFGLNTAIGFFSSDILSASSLVEIHKYSDYDPQDTYYTEEITLNVPTGAKYFAFTIRTDSVSSAYVKASQIVSEQDSLNTRISTLEEGASAFFIDPTLHLEGTTENPLALIKKEGGLASAFESWGFIGDSLASGEIWGWLNVQKTLVASKNNKMVDDSGDIVDASGYIISEPLQGQTYKPKFVVEFASNTGLSSSMCVIAKCDASGNILAVGTVGGTATKYTFSVSDNQYVVICYPSGNVPSVRCVSNFVQDNYDISWGQYMCRICGSEGVNYSKGGGTAKKFVLGQSPFDSTNSLSKLKSDTQKQAYILAFGVNDLNNAMYDGNVTDIEDVGADVNLADPSQNANTFAGYYARAIQEIKNIFPDSFVFLVTIPESSGYDEMNEIIRAMPEIFDGTYSSIYVLDLKEYLPASALSQFRMNGVHFNAQGYAYFAFAFCTYIDWLFRTYPGEFKGVSLIGKALLNNPS